MKMLLLCAALLGSTVQRGGSAAAQGGAEGTFVDHAKVANCTKGGSLFTSPEYTVICYSRKGPGQVEVHAKTTHVLYITDGSADVIVGGTPVGGKEDRPGELRAPNVEGGVSRHVVPGDVVIVPAGVPHWFKQVPGTVSYFSVNPLKK